MGIDRTAILRQVDKLAQKRRKEERKKEFRTFQQETVGLRDRVNPEKAANLRAASAEEALLAALLRYPEFGPLAAEQLPPGQFATSFNRRVYAALLEMIKNGAEPSLSGLSGQLSEEEMSAVARITARYHDVPVTKEDVKEYINVLQSEHAARQAEKAVNAAEPQELMRYLESLRDQKK